MEVQPTPIGVSWTPFHRSLPVSGLSLHLAQPGVRNILNAEQRYTTKRASTQLLGLPQKKIRFHRFPKHNYCTPVCRSRSTPCELDSSPLDQRQNFLSREDVGNISVKTRCRGLKLPSNQFWTRKDANHANVIDLHYTETWLSSPFRFWRHSSKVWIYEPFEMIAFLSSGVFFVSCRMKTHWLVPKTTARLMQKNAKDIKNVGMPQEWQWATWQSQTSIA